MARRSKLDLAYDAAVRVAQDWDGDEIPLGVLVILQIANQWSNDQVATFKGAFDQMKAFQATV